MSNTDILPKSAFQAVDCQDDYYKKAARMLTARLSFGYTRLMQLPGLSTRDRELVLTISVFLLGHPDTCGLFWNVISASYVSTNSTVSVGISTIKGKHGTPLTTLRRTARPLSTHLYNSGLTFRKPHVHFYLHTEENELAKIERLLETLEAQINK